MFVWMARDKGSEWRALTKYQAHGRVPFRPFVEAVCEPFMVSRDRPGKSPRAVMEALSQNLNAATDSGRVWLDLGNLRKMFSDKDIAEMLRLVGRRQGLLHHLIVPVVRATTSDVLVEECFKWAASADSGLCVRVDGFTHLEEKADRVAEVVRASGLAYDSIDLLVDAQDLPRSFTHEEIAHTIPVSQEARAWIWAAGSFPSSITHFSPEVYEHRFERTEWTAYLEEVMRQGSFRKPLYADYATQAPVYELSPPFRASPSLRYTLDDSFVVIRGRGGSGPTSQQYIGHARYLMGRNYYANVTSTPGDEYVALISAGANGTGNGTTWRVASILRHLGVVAAQIAAVPAIPTSVEGR